MWYDKKKQFRKNCEFTKRYEEHDMLHLYFAPLEGNHNISIQESAPQVFRWCGQIFYTISGTGTGAGDEREGDAGCAAGE